MPIKVYHGTDYEFDKFDMSHIGKVFLGEYERKGFYFTEDMETAGNYGKDVIEVLLYLENPADEKHVFSLARDLVKKGHTEEEALKKLGYDSIVITFNTGRKEYVAFYPEQIEIVKRHCNWKRCQLIKEIAEDIKQKECQTEDTKCEIATEIADKVVKKECSVYNVNWDTTKTDIPIFDMSILYPDDPKKHYNCELKWLTLDEFLEWQCKTKNTTKEEFLSWIGEDTVNSIIEGIKKGNAFNAFVLEFDEEGRLEDFQEGRHRIIAMKRLGIERVPVYFCTKIY